MFKGLKRIMQQAADDVGARGVNLGDISRIPHAAITPSDYPDCIGMREYGDVVRDEIGNFIACGAIDMYCANALDNSIDSKTLEELRLNDKAYIDRRGSARILVAERQAAIHDVDCLLARCEDAEGRAVSEVDEIEARIAELDVVFNGIQRKIVSVAHTHRETHIHSEAEADDDNTEEKGA